MEKFSTIYKQIVLNIINILGSIGIFTIFVYKVLICLFSRPFYYKILLKNIIKLGFNSILLVSIASLFSGAVLSLHIHSSIGNIYSETKIVPEILALSIWRELGPVLISLVITSRVGSAISAEIATMKVTEQIDALFVLAINPLKYLFSTRILALVLTIPLLVLLGNVISLIGGTLVSKINYNIDVYKFVLHIRNILSFTDFFCTALKSLIFSILISLISCFFGFYAENGAQGVGDATIKSVVVSSISIFIFNYIITSLLFL